jgi:hypothetical protein
MALENEFDLFYFFCFSAFPLFCFVLDSFLGVGGEMHSTSGAGVRLFCRVISFNGFQLFTD